MKNNAFENKKQVNYKYEVRDYIKILHRKNSHMCSTTLS